MTINEARATAQAEILMKSDAPPRGESDPSASCQRDQMDKEKARNHANDAAEASRRAEEQATIAKDNRKLAQEAAINAQALQGSTRVFAEASQEAAAECRELANDMRASSKSLSSALKDISVLVDAQANAQAKCDAPHSPHSHPSHPASGQPGMTTVVHSACSFGRPADEIAASMSQLNTLLLGASPAFAQAMRLQTDAIASGLGVLNAISNQQSHHALELASTARGVVESYDRSSSSTAK